MDTTTHPPTTEFRLYFTESVPEGAVNHNLLLLHEDGQSREAWSTGGVLDSLASHGHRAVAVDMPGTHQFGCEGPCASTRQKRLVDAILKEMDLTRTVVVGTGRSAIYLMAHMSTAPPPLGGVLGYVLVSPPQSDMWPADDYGLVPAPTLLMVGEEDMASRTRHHLARVPNLKYVSIGGATKACETGRPLAFIKAILSFLDGLDMAQESDNAQR